MGCATCQREFRFFKLGFVTHDEEKISGCQWTFPGSCVVHLLWRFILFGYVIGWIVVVFLQQGDAGWTSISDNNRSSSYSNLSTASNSTDVSHPIIVYLTVWSYLVLGAYLVWAFIVSLWVSCTGKDTDGSSGGYFTDRYTSKKKSWSLPADGATNPAYPRKESKELNDFANLNEEKIEQELVSGAVNTSHSTTCWYMKLDWFLYAISSNVSPIITAVYFAMLYPQIKDYFPGYTVSLNDLNLHGINTVIIFLDAIERAAPVRLLHVIYPLLYGIIYIIFSVVYWSFDKVNNVLYPGVLDWNYPGWTIMMMSLLCFIALPIVQLLLFGLSRVKLFVYRHICG